MKGRERGNNMAKLLQQLSPCYNTCTVMLGGVMHDRRTLTSEPGKLQAGAIGGVAMGGTRSMPSSLFECSLDRPNGDDEVLNDGARD